MPSKLTAFDGSLVFVADDGTHEWKGVRTRCYRDPEGPIRLFDLRNDPAEKRNVAEAHPEVVARIDRILREDRIPSPVYPVWDYHRPKRAKKKP